MSKKIIFVTILIVLVLFTNIAITLAATKTELQNQQSDLNSKIENTKNEISEVEEQMSTTMKQIQSLTAQISEYEIQIDDLDKQLQELESSIAETQVKLEEAEKKYNEQESNLQARIVAQYEAGETTYLDVLLGGGSLWDMISNWQVASDIAEMDNRLLEQIEANKIEIEEAKKTLETNRQQVETIKNNKQSTAQTLKSSQETKEQYVSQLSQDEKSLQEELDQFEADKQAIQSELAELARKEAASGKSGTIITGNPSASGYIFPVAGLSKNNINNRNYPSYPGHTGVDVNINVVGKSVVAVKSGTVEISTALTNSNGTYRSYGEYVVINHHDGTMTLYAHMIAGSRTVSKGQSVSQGQVLGIVGSTGRSTGTHLHFEVRINGSAVNPLPYLP
ncbi:MAG: peptidoglycan DD-metalloendopeptidase family protein [Clostridia bacterium]|nr:peptidoglycan DD-metalloendopeptidase family protein [Clostridia bacterium]